MPYEEVKDLKPSDFKRLLGQSWGIHESTVCRIVKKVENLLIRSQVFSLPGKRKLHQAAYEWKVLVVDVTETPIERPKKARLS